MKKIIICGSISAAEEIIKVQKSLEDKGFPVEIPESIKNPELQSWKAENSEESAQDKIKYDLLKGYFNKIKQADIVLIVNPEKNGIPDYIGGNTLIEMAFAHVLNKKLYCLNPIPDLPYTSEIIAMQPIVINGELDLIAQG